MSLDVEPQALTECNCSICRRYGVLWAYYSPVQVHFTGQPVTDVYMWNDRAIGFHRCRVCGCVSHWSAADAAVDRMGVNARLIEPNMIRQVRVRRLDGAVTGRYVDEWPLGDTLVMRQEPVERT